MGDGLSTSFCVESEFNQGLLIAERLYRDRMYYYMKNMSGCACIAAQKSSKSKRAGKELGFPQVEIVGHCSLRLYACKCVCDKLRQCTVFVIMWHFMMKRPSNGSG